MTLVQIQFEKLFLLHDLILYLRSHSHLLSSLPFSSFLFLSLHFSPFLFFSLPLSPFLFLSLPFSSSIFGLNKHNRLIDNMASDGVEQLTIAIQSNAALGGKLTTLNITRNVMNLACSQGASSCLQHDTFQFYNCSPPVECLH